MIIGIIILLIIIIIALFTDNSDNKRLITGSGPISDITVLSYNISHEFMRGSQTGSFRIDNSYIAPNINGIFDNSKNIALFTDYFNAIVDTNTPTFIALQEASGIGKNSQYSSCYLDGQVLDNYETVSHKVGVEDMYTFYLKTLSTPIITYGNDSNAIYTQLTFEDEKIIFYNVHLHGKPNFLSNLPASTTHLIIVAGDFNDKLSIIPNGWSKTSIVTHISNRSIDHVAVNKIVRFTSEKTIPQLTPPISDHYPLVASIINI